MAKQDEQYICDRFRGLIPGKEPATVTEISLELGNISYQGVHRILKKNGLGRKDGGKAAQVAIRDDGIVDMAPVMCDKYGCTKEQWDELRAFDEDYKKTPLAAFHTFKNNFQNLYPDVAFELSLWEWWTAWKDSGKWGQHKRNPDGMFVLVQKDKDVAISNANIRIIPFGDYLKETRKTKPRKVKEKVVKVSEPEECT
jgi:hypothetical protein